MGDVEKKFPASACWKKKIACSTNVIESLWEKREKNILPTRLLEKKFLMTRNHPPPLPPCPQELNGRPLICKPIKHTKEVVLPSYVNFFM